MSRAVIPTWIRKAARWGTKMSIPSWRRRLAITAGSACRTVISSSSSARARRLRGTGGGPAEDRSVGELVVEKIQEGAHLGAEVLAAFVQHEQRLLPLGLEPLQDGHQAARSQRGMDMELGQAHDA